MPGVAKTLLVRSLAAALDVETKRVQFTPDLMPGDLTGSLVYDASSSDFTFRQGPVFTNLLLADEINRTPPKTQSALLEAMEERQVSVDGRAHPLPATVHGRRHPEPGRVRRHLSPAGGPARPVPAQGHLAHPTARRRDRRAAQARDRVRPARPATLRAAAGRRRPPTWPPAPKPSARSTISDEVTAYIVDIARATRSSPSLALGVSPRGATALMATSRAWAWINGRGFVTPDDVKALAHATLAHRLSLRPEAELEGVSVDGRPRRARSESVPVPR